MRPIPRRIHISGLLFAGAGLAATALPLAGPAAGAPPISRVSLTPIGTYHSGDFDESAAEIVAFDPGTHRLFVVNANDGVVDVLDLSDPTEPTKVDELVASGGINSVAVRDGLVAVAVQGDPAQEPGTVELFTATGESVGDPISVGALPDMLTFTPDGSRIVVANEGEPDGYCDGGVDPEGSISIIDVATHAVSTADFKAFNDQEEALRVAGVRIFGPDATVAEDLEPEYVAIDADSATAWVSLQENNAFAIVDLASARVTDIVPLGYKDHSLADNGLDASNKDDEINIRPWPVSGMYQPDAIDAYSHGDSTYLVTANEGDARDYECYSEEARIGDLGLDPDAFPDADDLQRNDALGRLNTTTAFPTTDPATELYAYGARSFSIRDADGALVFDSGDDFERITAAALPADFNSNNDENGSFDARSDDKGPEPEGIEIGNAYGKTYAFIGLERVGGIMVYDITTPHNPRFVQYVNNRDFDEPATLADGTSNPAAGDLGPEGLTFISAEDSPTGHPLLAVGNEVSGTTTVYRLDGPGRPR
ncbi:choice-of-anchor I family protein [Quadrisphaera sp. GCM10027208]|uniref:choice-of-anchor I family protein n=1 Tax=Quadrisphaera sp. GCM10027208 TaxID=3273423 RepID=UPI00361B3818